MSYGASSFIIFAILLPVTCGAAFESRLLPPLWLVVLSPGTEGTFASSLLRQHNRTQDRAVREGGVSMCCSLCHTFNRDQASNEATTGRDIPEASV
uniref:Putative secreted protein n=1 Tax=Anopheles marajoara TaxID=58244 RepID=A0A2M4C986_9DIPT